MQQLLKKVQIQLESKLSSKRLAHSRGVSETAARLAVRYGTDPAKATLAGLLHDCAREIPNNLLLKLADSFGILISNVEAASPFLLHGPVGACLARSEYGLTDQMIIDAIQWHTTGRAGMSLLEKIIFLADYIEPNRSYPGVEHLRSIADLDLDKAVLAGYNQTLKYLLSRGELIHVATVEGRNDLLYFRN